MDFINDLGKKMEQAARTLFAPKGDASQALNRQLQDAYAALGRAAYACARGEIEAVPPECFDRVRDLTTTPDASRALMGLSNCPACGSALPSEARYCPRCGKALPRPDEETRTAVLNIRTCPRCGRVLDENDSHCPHCGSAPSRPLPTKDALTESSPQRDAPEEPEDKQRYEE